MPTTLQLEDTPLIENGTDLLSQDGRHTLPGELAGAQVYAEVRDGKVVGYEAERDGETIETFVLRQVPSKLTGNGGQLSAEAPREEVRCFLCAQSGTTMTCREVPCPGGG